MTDPQRPWTDHLTMQNLLADWRSRYGGRPLFRVSAGNQWVRLHLEGDARAALWLTWLPGAQLAFASEGTLPSAVNRALDPVKRHPLAELLKDCHLAGAGMVPGDRVAALRLDRGPHAQFFLLHQMYGARGNTVLLDAQGRLLWARHRPPTGPLAVPPPPATWTAGTASAPDPGVQDVSHLAWDHLVARLITTHLQNSRSDLDRVRRKTARLVENLQQDLEKAEKSEHFRRQAETLAAHLHAVKQGQDRLVVPDLRDGEPRDIALDPAQSPSANLDAWFRKARKAEKGRDIIQARWEEARQAADKLDLAAARLEDIAQNRGEGPQGLDELLDWHAHHAHLLPTRGGQATPSGKHGPDEPARPFRRYLIDDTFEVWVGRNNKENDELTHRASHSRDLWLHAQGVSGSHVILRTAGRPEAVPKTVLAKAAALAALNSKARHSSLVPVIYTERRYVRKPRKSPPGLATCLRDKSLFVEPGIHPGVRSI